MLEGLKSWNAFSEYGSDDLDFFKQEQLEKAYLMFSKGSSDTEIINFLVNKLADLYLFEELYFCKTPLDHNMIIIIAW